MTGDKLTIPRVIAALKKVPEKRFGIVDIAPELVDEDGTINISRCMDRQADLKMAILEVQSNAKATRQMAGSLLSIRNTPSSLQDDDLDDDLDDDWEDNGE